MSDDEDRKQTITSIQTIETADGEETHVTIKSEPKEDEDGMVDLMGSMPNIDHDEKDNVEDSTPKKKGQEESSQTEKPSKTNESNYPVYNENVNKQQQPPASEMSYHNKLSKEETQNAPSLTLFSNMTLLFSTLHFVLLFLLVGGAITFQIIFDKNGGYAKEEFWIKNASQGLYITTVVLYWIGFALTLAGGLAACFAGGNAMKNWAKIPIIVISFIGAGLISLGAISLCAALITAMVIFVSWQSAATSAISSLGYYFQVWDIIFIVLFCISSLPLIVVLVVQGIQAIRARQFEIALENERESYTQQVPDS